MLTIPLDNYLISFVIDASKPYDIEIIDSIYSMFKKENQVSAIRIPFPLTEHPYLSFIHSFNRSYQENVHSMNAQRVHRTMSYFLLNVINNDLLPLMLPMPLKM